jgi:hypothetical protein
MRLLVRRLKRKIPQIGRLRFIGANWETRTLQEQLASGSADCSVIRPPSAGCPGLP